MICRIAVDLYYGLCRHRGLDVAVALAQTRNAHSLLNPYLAQELMKYL